MTEPRLASGTTVWFAGAQDALSARLAKEGGPNPYFDVQLAHDRYDEFWQQRAITPHLKNIRAAVLTVGPHAWWLDLIRLPGLTMTLDESTSRRKRWACRWSRVKMDSVWWLE